MAAIAMLMFSAVLVACGEPSAEPLESTIGTEPNSGEGFSQNPNGPDDSSNADAELEDLQFVATKSGISLQEAIDRYGWYDDFSQAVSEIRETSPEAFAGAAITGDTEAWVSFAGQTPGAAQEIISAFNTRYPSVSVEIRTGLGFTEQELERAIAGAHFAVYESAGVLDATSSFDYDTRQISVTAKMEKIPSAPALDDLRNAAQRGATDATRPDILSVIAVSVTGVDYTP